MTKKSVKEKKANAEGKDRPAPKRRPLERIPDLYIYAGLGVVFLFSLYLRVYKPMSRVLVGDTVLFDGNDGSYHIMLAKSTVLNLQRPWFDPMTFFPGGTEITFGPFNSWAIAILSYIADLGTPRVHTVEVVGAVLPAVFGALLVFIVYFIGRELGGRTAGFMAAVMIAVLPGQFLSRSLIGFADHHASEVLLSTTAMLFFILAFRSGAGKLAFSSLRGRDLPALKRPLAYCLLAGLFLGLYIDAWSSGHLFVGIILAFVTIQSIVDHMRGRSAEYLGILGSIAFFVALLLILPFVRAENGFGFTYYSLFQPTILIVGIVFMFFLAVVSSQFVQRKIDRRYFPLIIIGSIAVVFVILVLAVPQFTGALTAGLKIFQPRTGGGATISEASSILERYAIQRNFPGIVSILSPFWLTLIALPLIFLRYRRDDSRNGDMLILVWTVIILALTFAQNRFAYYYAVNVAFLAGYLGSVLLERTRFLEVEDAFVRMARGSSNEAPDQNQIVVNVAAVALLAILFIYPSIFGAVQGVPIGSFYSQNQVGPMNSDWYESMFWLRDNTPEPGMGIYTIYDRPPKGEKFPYPDSAYGTMSWWDYGHLITYLAKRIPNANPFQSGVAGENGAATFFLSETEERNTAIADTLGTRYVMTDIEMSSGKFWAMATWYNSSAGQAPYVKTVLAPEEGPQGSYSAVSLYDASYFNTMIARLHNFDGSMVAGGQAYYVEVDDRLSSYPVATAAQMMDTAVARAAAEAYNQNAAPGTRAMVLSSNLLTPIDNVPALKHYRLVHESPTNVVPAGAGWDIKYVKVFEYVPGARIQGTGVIALDLVSNTGRTFTYKQASTDGEFIVPYSTTGSPYEVKAAGRYRIEGTGREIDVPETAVMQGLQVG